MRISEWGNVINFELSDIPNRHDLGDKLKELSLELHELAKAVAKLEVQGRNVMMKTIDGYDALRVRLENSSNMTFSPDVITGFRDRLLASVQDWLSKLQTEVHNTLLKTDETLETAKGIREALSGTQASIVKERKVLLIPEEFWMRSFLVGQRKPKQKTTF